MKDVARTGVCVVRAELDPYAGLRITVTLLPDVDAAHDATCSTTTSVDVAVEQVRQFLDAVRDAEH
jgi:hypothetical protein